MQLREVTFDDAGMLFDWANDPDTRAASAISAPIEWEEHVTWLKKKLSSDAARLWIGVDDDGANVGLVRFDIDDGAAEIGVNLAPQHRGRGLAAPLIAAGCLAVFEASSVTVIVARIKQANVASRRAFENAGFAPAGEQEARGQRMLRYEKARFAQRPVT